MKKIIIAFFLFFSLTTLGQSSNDKVVYLDSLFNETDSINSVGKRVIKDYYIEKEIYTLEEFFKDKIMLSAQVSNKDILIKNGKFTTYYENGNKRKMGYYLKNMLIGNATEWYENGNIKGEYSYESKNIESEAIVLNFWDEDGVQKVKDGTGDYSFELGFKTKEISISGKVEKGLLHGKWTTKLGDFPYFEEYYNNGKLLNGVRKQSNNESFYYTEVAIQPQPIGGLNEFRAMIGSKIKTKKQKTAIQGTVIAKFIVDSNGKIQNPVIIKSLNDYFDNQLINILNNCDNWSPGMYRGLAVKGHFTIPVTVKVEETN